mmetsp:Transcript_10258/g.23132  ORF Transcript_10258/g.23132 Transcript_10258/m.23132 type:complete len:256 (+) Transcript_10258:3-770(+)
MEDDVFTCLASGASPDEDAPGSDWSQRQLRIFEKAMQLEDSFRFVPQRGGDKAAKNPLAAPTPTCEEGLSEVVDADHTRLLLPRTTVAYIEGLQSSEGQKLNGSQGVILDHQIKAGNPPELRCCVQVKSAGENKKIKRENLKTMAAVFKTNCFEFEDTDGRKWWELFDLASRFNHSCIPNIGFEHVRLGRSELVHGDGECDWHLVTVALRQIQAGEELTVDYVGPAESLEHRRCRLARRYNFVCQCELCALQGCT